MNQPKDRDAQEIEHNHGRGIDGHVHDVSGRSQNGGKNEEEQAGAAYVLEEEFGAHHAHGAGKSQHNGQFKNNCQAKNDGEEEVGVLVDGNVRPEIGALADQEIHGHGKDDAVAEEAAAHEQADGENQEGQEKALLMAVESRRDKSPDLVKQKRTGDKDTDDQADLELDIKGVSGIEIDQVRIEAVILQRLLDGGFHSPDDLIHLVPARRDADGDGSQGVQD